MGEGRVDYCVRLRGAARETVRLLESAAVHFSAGLLEPPRAGVRACQSKDLMAGPDEFGNDPGADETGRAGHEHTHAKPAIVLRTILRDGAPC
jgi:hypothetical protein